MMQFKKKYVLLTCLIVLPVLANSSALDKKQNCHIRKAPIPNDWFSKALGEIRRNEYNPSLQNFDYNGKQFTAPRCHFTNRAKNFRAYADENGIDLMPRISTKKDHWFLKYHLYSIRRADGDIHMYGDVAPTIFDNGIIYNHGNIIEEFTNSESGISQTLVLQTRPHGQGNLHITINLETQNAFLSQQTSNRIIFTDGENEIVYHLIEIEDEAHNVLHPHVDYENNQLVVSIDDTYATYPLSIHTTISTNHSETEQRIYFRYSDMRGLSTTPNWTAEANQDSAYFGAAVATAGDVNGDGHSDVIIGAYHFDNGQLDEGCAFVFHGSALGLSTTPDWNAEPDQDSAYFGISVSTAGDVNNDGYSDVIIGAHGYDNGESNEGRACVYHGSASGLSTTVDWTAEPNALGAGFGHAVATAGDVNDDGYSDVIVGAYLYDVGDGRAFVYHGSSSGLSSSANWTMIPDQTAVHFGYSVSTAGDVNGDGYADVIVGVPDYNAGETEEGASYVYHGSSSGLSSTEDWFASSGQASAHFGISVATAGDVNGDGYADVIVGANEYDNTETDEGGAFVYHGSASGLSLTADWTAEADQDSALFGISVSLAGDVNGDGYSDVIVGAHGYDNNQTEEGSAYMYYGGASGLSQTADWSAEVDQDSAFFGVSVSLAGDVNGDGYSDVIVGADAYDNGETDEGRAFVYHGSASGLSTTADWNAESDQDSTDFGVSVRTAGDVNGDGYSDIIIGAPYYDNGHTDEGCAFVYHGGPTGPSTSADWTAEVNQDSAFFGVSVSTAGDVNGDGYSDVIVGAHGYDNTEKDEGAAFVYHGSTSGLSTSADWNAESNQDSANFGNAVSTAGDVNGDGYSDVIVGAYLYDNSEDNEGYASVYHGSASGLATTADWTAEANQDSANFGASVATVGDVDGDGYSDVIVGAYAYDNVENNEGRAFVYHGSTTGLSQTANWTAEPNQGTAYFGLSVASAGDVNGDGYSDAIVGAPFAASYNGRAYVYHGSLTGLSQSPDWTESGAHFLADFGISVATAGDVNGDGYSDIIIGSDGFGNGQDSEGCAYVYYGSAAGLSTSADWSVESDQISAYFGISVFTAGDVNGDGYSDVIVGADDYDNDQYDEGRSFIYYGNTGGLAYNPRQAVPDGSRLVQLLNALNYTGMGLQLLCRTPGGRGKVKLQWEIKELGQSFNSTNLGISSDWYDTGVNGNDINQYAHGLKQNTAYHWRVRLKYSPLSYNGSIYSRWFSIGPNGMNETDFVNTSPIGVKEKYTRAPMKLLLNVSPTVSAKKFKITYICDRGVVATKTPVNIKVYDAAGRLVKTVIEATMSPGSYATTWDGDDDCSREVSSGVYFIYLTTGEYKSVEKVLFVK